MLILAGKTNFLLFWQTEGNHKNHTSKGWKSKVVISSAWSYKVRITGWFSIDCCGVSFIIESCPTELFASMLFKNCLKLLKLYFYLMNAAYRSTSNIFIEASTEPVAITDPTVSNAAALHGALWEVT